MKKEYLRPYYYASIQYKGFYKDTKKYKSLEELEQALKSIYKYRAIANEYYPIIDYVIYEINPIKRLLTQNDQILYIYRWFLQS